MNAPSAPWSSPPSLPALHRLALVKNVHSVSRPPGAAESPLPCHLNYCLTRNYLGFVFEVERHCSLPTRIASALTPATPNPRARIRLREVTAAQQFDASSWQVDTSVESREETKEDSVEAALRAGWPPGGAVASLRCESRADERRQRRWQQFVSTLATSRKAAVLHCPALGSKQQLCLVPPTSFVRDQLNCEVYDDALYAVLCRPPSTVRRGLCAWPCSRALVSRAAGVVRPH